MVQKTLRMLPAIVKTALVLVFACLICQSSAKPALKQWLDSFAAEQQLPPYIVCRTSSDCNYKQCCKIGRQRFSIPECSVYGGAGDLCFPDAMSVSKNLSYPDGVTVQFEDVYDNACPCAPGLYCDSYSLSCVEDEFAVAESVLDELAVANNRLDGFVLTPSDDDYFMTINNL